MSVSAKNDLELTSFYDSRALMLLTDSLAVGFVLYHVSE